MSSSRFLHSRLGTQLRRRQASIPWSALSRLALSDESACDTVETARLNAIKKQVALICRHAM